LVYTDTMVKKGDQVELNIESMAIGGRGIGRIDGLVVFVTGSIPGDRVRARVVRKKREYAEAVVAEVLTPSPDRVEPPCPYFGYCGGCQWQHVAYERQRFYKRELVRGCIEHIGGLKDSLIRETLPSPATYAYRNKMEFSFSDHRWLLPRESDLSGPSRGFALGLHVPGTFDKVLDIDACLLVEGVTNEILREVKEITRSSGIPAYGLKTHQGFWRFLTIRHSRALDQWMVNVITSEYQPVNVRPLADRLTNRFPTVTSVINTINTGKAAIATGDREVLLFGLPRIKDRLGSYVFHISPNSFFQTNTAAAERLYETVSAYAELGRGETVLDLYCGTGTIPILLSPRAGLVTGIEMSPSAVLDAERNCKENGIDNCRFIQGDARRMLGQIGAVPDVVVLDPPRSGMHEDVVKGVLDLSPKRIVYVSCNPATLARDLGRMTPAYELVAVQPVDMFPNTHHVETVVKLRQHLGC
jgi:23S rRNA (uracil1939-C5)-methyltransferase